MSSQDMFGRATGILGLLFPWSLPWQRYRFVFNHLMWCRPHQVVPDVNSEKKKEHLLFNKPSSTTSKCLLPYLHKKTTAGVSLVVFFGVKIKYL